MREQNVSSVVINRIYRYKLCDPLVEYPLPDQALWDDFVREISEPVPDAEFTISLNSRGDADVYTSLSLDKKPEYVSTKMHRIRVTKEIAFAVLSFLLKLSCRISYK